MTYYLYQVRYIVWRLILIMTVVISHITDQIFIIRMRPLVPIAAQFGIDKKKGTPWLTKLAVGAASIVLSTFPKIWMKLMRRVWFLKATDLLLFSI